MNTIPLVRAAALSPVLEALASLGAPAEPLLEKVRLPPPHALRPDALLPYQQVLDLLAIGVRSTADAGLLALAARRAEALRLGGFGRLLARTKTLGDLLQTLSDSSWMLTNGARWWIEASGSDVILCHQFHRRLDLGQGGALILVIAFVVGALRRVLGEAYQPSEITVALPLPLAVERLGLARSARVTGATSIRIPRHLLATPAPYVAVLSAESAGALATDLARSAPAEDFVGSIRQALVQLAGTSQVPIAALGEITRIPVRTLQRRLAENGTSFSAVVEEVRFAKAVRRMADPSAKLIDVAFELGFSDPAHFTRAFRRWAGVSPREFRRAQAADHLVPTGTTGVSMRRARGLARDRTLTE